VSPTIVSLPAGRPSSAEPRPVRAEPRAYPGGQARARDAAEVGQLLLGRRRPRGRPGPRGAGTGGLLLRRTPPAVAPR
jgi:hypothetical protein